MQNRQQHQPEVRAFLQKQFSSRHWEFTLPYGNGKETYFAHGNGNTYFVKLGGRIANYQAMASIGLTPPVIATGFLEDETPLLVQQFITGRKPSRKDYRAYLEQIATIINRTHLSPEVRDVLLEASSDLYSVLGFQALTCVQQRWDQYKPLVPTIASGLMKVFLTSHNKFNVCRERGL